MKDIEIIKNIILKASEKLRNAEILYKEKAYDDAASRAYYCVYHAISAVLFTKNLTFSSHKETIGNFNKEFINTNIFPKDYNMKIEMLFNTKQIGDYDVKKNIDMEQAEENINYAFEIITKCKEYLTKLYGVDKKYWNIDK